MFNLSAVLAIVAAVSGAATAQPADNPDQATRSVGSYLYLIDSQGNRVLLSTQFWRNDPKYDERALHRFFEVLSGLEKRGFHKDQKAAIDNWDKAEPTARCYVYMEDLQAGRKTKNRIVTGSRIWCTDNGASEHEIKASDNPKHVNETLKYFDIYFARAKRNLHE